MWQAFSNTRGVISSLSHGLRGKWETRSVQVFALTLPLALACISNTFGFKMKKKKETFQAKAVSPPEVKNPGVSGGKEAAGRADSLQQRAARNEEQLSSNVVTLPRRPIATARGMKGRPGTRLSAFNSGRRLSARGTPDVTEAAAHPSI
ncbi:hypothetical protein E2C01_091299 [Portunus trituberculatus]|uniref:Uncharacterized protein n=1 Tax=Portunus trituberculatus TaxID=210409 RepID=A0A5B7JIR4_PORTR|nr:hypothetical protein [Portunus trituberculatus]